MYVSVCIYVFICSDVLPNDILVSAGPHMCGFSIWIRTFPPAVRNKCHKIQDANKTHQVQDTDETQDSGSTGS